MPQCTFQTKRKSIFIKAISKPTYKAGRQMTLALGPAAIRSNICPPPIFDGDQNPLTLVHSPFFL